SSIDFAILPVQSQVGSAARAKLFALGAALARKAYAAESAYLRKRDDTRRDERIAKATAAWQRGLDALAAREARRGTPLPAGAFASLPAQIAASIRYGADRVGTHALERSLPGLLAYWPFDEDAPGANRAPNGDATLDLSFHGQAHVAAGAFGGALSVDGNGDYARVANALGTAKLAATGSFTIVAWLRAAGPGSDATAGGIVVSKEGEYEIARFADASMNYALATPAHFWTWRGAGGPAPLDEWRMVALVVNASGVVTFQFDFYSALGTNYTTFPFGDAHPGEDEFRIGGRQNQAQWFDGEIDEVAVWQRALSSLEIFDLYDAGAGMPLAWAIGD
ncbi:MAG: LamG domain-containing protein, partial [Myxococcales bacterium]|nr:LamG domain-containing protein [Myxococcales bacterium]